MNAADTQNLHRESRANEKFLEIFKLEKTYPTPNGPSTIVRDFDLSLREGEFVSIIGHSGCGKSTVLSIVAGLNHATSGGVVLAGKEVVDAGPDRGVVFQAPCLLHWLSALENVLLGVEQVTPDKTDAERREIASHYLKLVGLGDSLNKRPAELSSGMRQRVGLARAFALSPKLLLLDEPFGMLDSLTRIELHEVLIDLWAQDRKTALMVTHDVDEALFLSDRVVMMTTGPEARVGEILTVPFARPRSRAALLEDPQYYELRERLIGFLENEAHHRPPPAPAAAPVRNTFWGMLRSLATR
jgi:nitrate/nitrite transport system ATP-binding protein